MATPRLGSALDILLPRYCLACDAPLTVSRRRWLCAGCLARIEPVGPSPCPVCAGRLGPSAAPSQCRDCRRLRPRFDGAVAVGRYEGLFRDLIPRFKYARETSLAWPLGELLAETLELWPRLPEVEAVAPMPLAFGRRLLRGFNQAELLAEETARRLDLPLLRRALRRRGGSHPQAGLSRSRRLRSPAGAMVGLRLDEVLRPALDRLPGKVSGAIRHLASNRARGKCVLLIDDVLTTGASASEAARALVAAGARKVLVAVVARA